MVLVRQYIPDHWVCKLTLLFLLKVGQVSRGIDCYYQALNLQPEFVNAYKKWAESRVQEKKGDGTFIAKIADFLKALQTEPHSLSVYKYFGEILAVNRNL